MKNYYRIFVLSGLLLLTACGSQETILPTDPLSDEQVAAIQAEDAAVEDEEGQSMRVSRRPQK